MIKEFECNGKEMVLVKTTDAAHVMDKEEWKKYLVCGILRDGRIGNELDKIIRKQFEGLFYEEIGGYIMGDIQEESKEEYLMLRQGDRFKFCVNSKN